MSTQINGEKMIALHITKNQYNVICEALKQIGGDKMSELATITKEVTELGLINGENMIAIHINADQYDLVLEALEQMDCRLQKRIKICALISKRKELKMKSMDIEELFIVMAGEDDGL